MTTVATALEPRSRERAAYAELGLLTLLWAVSWPLMKLALLSVSPITFLIVRFFGAAAVATAVAVLRGQPLIPLRGERLQLGITGLCLIGINMALGTVALQYVGAGRAAVLIYTMQLWALPIGRIVLKERITAGGLIGSLIGFSGMVLFLNPMLVNWHDRRVLAGNLMLIASAILWAIGSCLYRRRRWQTPMWTQVSWQVLLSALAVTVFGLLAGTRQHIEWNALVVGVLLFNWLLSTSVAYWLWNRALAVLPAAKAGQLTTLVPVLAFFASVIFLKESISAGAIVSIGLIVCGIFVTLRAK